MEEQDEKKQRKPRSGGRGTTLLLAELYAAHNQFGIEIVEAIQSRYGVGVATIAAHAGIPIGSMSQFIREPTKHRGGFPRALKYIMAIAEELDLDPVRLLQLYCYAVTEQDIASVLYITGVYMGLDVNDRALFLGMTQTLYKRGKVSDKKQATPPKECGLDEDEETTREDLLE